MCINVAPDFQYITVWEETLAVEKFGKFIANLILAEENLANLPILKLKNCTAKLERNFLAYH